VSVQMEEEFFPSVLDLRPSRFARTKRLRYRPVFRRSDRFGSFPMPDDSADIKNRIMRRRQLRARELRDLRRRQQIHKARSGALSFGGEELTTPSNVLVGTAGGPAAAGTAVAIRDPLVEAPPQHILSPSERAQIAYFRQGEEFGYQPLDAETVAYHEEERPAPISLEPEPVEYVSGPYLRDMPGGEYLEPAYLPGRDPTSVLDLMIRSHERSPPPPQVEYKQVVYDAEGNPVTPKPELSFWQQMAEYAYRLGTSVPVPIGTGPVGRPASIEYSPYLKVGDPKLHQL